MNFTWQESSRKLRGGFYTDPVIASFLTRWIRAINPTTILEPSCGDGVFLQALQPKDFPSLRQVVAFEIEDKEAEKAKSRTTLPALVLNRDFLQWFLYEGDQGKRFDAVVGNPPFIRYQYLMNGQQKLAERIFALLKIPFTRHTNAWVPFVLASIHLLKPGGRLAMVIPSELLHISHAAALRRYLVEQCSRILLFDPQELMFQNVLQGTMLLLGEKKRDDCEKNEGVGVISIADRQILADNPETLFQSSTFTKGSAIERKWMPIFLNAKERDLFDQMTTCPGVVRFSEIASVDVGIVTGANKFFLVPDRIVEEFALQPFAHPMFGRSDHVAGLVFSDADLLTNKSSGLAANFLWFQNEDFDELPEKVRRYLNLGLRQCLDRRFKCRTRKCWYKVPSVFSTPIAMLKRAHHYPRLVLNRANAYTTDTAYRIRTDRSEPSALVAGFVNSLTCLSAELEGRHYAGGVLELVPSEIERMLLVVTTETYRELDTIDHRFRTMNDDLGFVLERDSPILGSIGLSRNDQTILSDAWAKLRNRRQRTNPPKADDSIFPDHATDLAKPL